MPLIAGVLLVGSGVVADFAHPGGLDSNGGHFDRRTNQYHYHRGGVAPAAQPAPMVLTAREDGSTEAALTELRCEVDAQAAEIAELKARLSALESKLSAMADTPVPAKPIEKSVQ